MFRNYIQTAMHPERYHEGWLKPPFFEGWYFKIVDKTQKHAWAFIVGVFRKPEIEKSEAFIQVLDGNQGKAHVFTFPYSSFSCDPKSFNVNLEGNKFSLNALEVHLQNKEISIDASIKFGEGKPWPVRWYSPGIMGPFGWLNFMECYHGVLSFDHLIKGNLKVNDQVLDFDEGQGYIEKDFGKAFPYAWVWMQTNNFDQPHTSLTVSVAMIPFMGLRFKGVIIGLLHQEHLHTFTTYNFSRIRSFQTSENSVSLEVTRGAWRLRLDGERVGGAILQAPVSTGMNRRIMESLNAWVRVRLWKKDTLILDDIGQRAGMEIIGDIDSLSGFSFQP
jgi:hypothetical protein